MRNFVLILPFIYQHFANLIKILISLYINVHIYTHIYLESVCASINHNNKSKVYLTMFTRTQTHIKNKSSIGHYHLLGHPSCFKLVPDSILCLFIYPTDQALEHFPSECKLLEFHLFSCFGQKLVYKHAEPPSNT